jgi:hypothetical protein
MIPGSQLDGNAGNFTSSLDLICLLKGLDEQEVIISKPSKQATQIPAFADIVSTALLRLTG